MKRSMTPRTGLDESTRMLKAFADPVRLRLLNLLGGEQEEVCVCHLHEALELPQPTVSRHLAYLRKHGLAPHPAGLPRHLPGRPRGLPAGSGADGPEDRLLRWRGVVATFFFPVY